MKRIVSFVLAMIMILSSPVQSMAWNPIGGTDNRLEGDSNQMYEPGRQDTYPTGLLPDEMIEVDVRDINVLTQTTPMFECARPLSEGYEHEWDTYSTNYFYNLLTDEEKALFDQLDEICRGFLTTDADAKEQVWNEESSSFHTGFIDVVGWTIDEIHEFVQIFRVNNPQYYFINNEFLYGTLGDTVTFSMGIYAAFADGDARAAATDEFGAQVDEWKEALSAYTSEEEIVYEIHRLICEKVDYNEVIYGPYDEEVEFTQTAYSVMCMDLTVCAGYAEAVALMCNAMGIDALCVTSYNHQWNKVRVEDQWYNVDATWDDQSYGIDYEFYLRSDDYYDNAAAQAESHEEEAFWEEYLPVCSLDSNPTPDGYYYETPGMLPTITMTVERPTIEVTEVAGEYQVRIYSEIDGATIYYTLDGTTPSVAFTKSIYGGALVNITLATAEEVEQLKAIAVLGGFYDSAVAVYEGDSGFESELPSVKITSIRMNGQAVELEWTRVTNADGYYVYRRTGQDWEKIATILSNAENSYRDTTVEDGQTYYYIVTAFKDVLEGEGEEASIVVDMTEQVENPFDDVSEDAYYYKPVLWAYENGITSGYAPNEFGTNGTCTRGEIVTFLWRAMGKPEPTTTNNPFTDVPAGIYYEKAVLWAYETGITSGLTETTFGPDKGCTREQIVTFLWRTMGKEEPTITEHSFADVPAGEYYTKAVLWAKEKGITSGLTAIMFGTGRTCIRADVVSFLYRTLVE